MELQEGLERRRLQEGRVAVQNHIGGEGFPKPAEHIARLLHGMAGAQLLRLFDDHDGWARPLRFDRRPHLLPLITDHDCDVLAGHLLCQIHRVQHHRPPRNRMQHLGQLGLHPLAESGRHHDGPQALVRAGLHDEIGTSRRSPAATDACVG